MLQYKTNIYISSALINNKQKYVALDVKRIQLCKRSDFRVCNKVHKMFLEQSQTMLG